jgi:DNA polymerase-3 subunit epsilon
MSTHYNPPDKTAAQQWARGLFALPKFYVIDTETTGVGKRDEVVQIGIVDKNGTTILDTLVKPTVPCSAGAANVHGITNAMLATAPDFFDVYMQVSKVIAGAPLIAYNMDFDWRLLQQSVNSRKLPMFRVGERSCAMKMYAQYRGVWNGKFGNYRWHKLGRAAAYEGILVKDAHNALGDVRMTLALLKKMAEQSS